MGPGPAAAIPQLVSKQGLASARISLGGLAQGCGPRGQGSYRCGIKPFVILYVFFREIIHYQYKILEYTMLEL